MINNDAHPTIETDSSSAQITNVDRGISPPNAVVSPYTLQCATLRCLGVVPHYFS